MKTKINNIAKDISRLNEAEISDLTSVLLTEHDISITMYRFGVSTGFSNSLNTEYKVTMTRTGMRKLLVVKTIKELLGLGLRDAKNIVDETPSTIKDCVTWSEAEELRIALEATGAKVEIKEV